MKMTDYKAEQIIGHLLRAGVLLAGMVVLGGGILYLVRHGSEHPEYHAFHGEQSALRSVGEIITEAGSGRALAIIQLGLLLLILTPIARVAFAALAFAMEKDRFYVLVTLIVLGVLLYSLLGT